MQFRKNIEYSVKYSNLNRFHSNLEGVLTCRQSTCTITCPGKKGTCRGRISVSTENDVHTFLFSRGVFGSADLVVQKAGRETFRTHLKTPRTAQWLWRNGGRNGGKYCSIPRCRLRNKRADSREGDARFGIGGFENPHPPIFTNLGRRGRAGEPGGTWGSAQGTQVYY